MVMPAVAECAQGIQSPMTAEQHRVQRQEDLPQLRRKFWTGGSGVMCPKMTVAVLTGFANSELAGPHKQQIIDLLMYAQVWLLKCFVSSAAPVFHVSTCQHD